MSRDNPGVVIFPPALFGLAFFGGLLIQWFFPWRLPLPEWLRLSAAVLLFLASGAFGVWGTRVMKAAGTNVNPGLPTTAVVSTGPFRYTRNPLYLSALGLYLGAAPATNTVWLLVLLIPLVLILDVGIVRREERYLEAKFGEPYRAYKKQVRRWV